MPLCVCTSAFGLSSAERDSISQQFELDEVVVKSQKSSATRTTSYQTLKGAQLEGLSTHSVADALRHFSGVQIKDFGGVGGIKTIDVRSMGTNHLGVFYDGIEIGNAQNGTVDLGKFSMDNIDELTLYNGPTNTIFQPAKDFASASTLFIRTRRPRFKDGQNYHITATMKAGTFGLANPALLYEQRLTENLHLSLNAEYNYATGRYHFTKKQGNIDTTGIRQNGDIQAVRAEAGLFGYLPDGNWHVKGYFYQSERGIPRAIIRNVWTTDQRQWDRNAFVQGNWTQSWSLNTIRKVALQVNAKYSNDYMRYLNPDTTSVYIDNAYWQQEVYVSVANQWTLFPWWDLDISADYIWNDLKTSIAQWTHPQRHTGLVAVAMAFHYRWIQAQVSCLGTFVQDKDEKVESQKVAKVPTPAISLSYQPILKELFYLRGFYKQMYRMPTFNELYYTDGVPSHLQPEQTTQYDGGIEYTKEVKVESPLALKSKVESATDLLTINVHAKADGYFNQVKNKIIAVPKGNTQYRWQTMNLGYVEIRGVDVNAGIDLTIPLSSSPTHPLTISANGTYTYQKAQDYTDSTDPLTYGGQIAYIPWHSSSVMTSVSWNGLSLQYVFNYVGTRYSASANTLANQVPAWHTHDLAVKYNIQHFHISLEINNLANQQYEIIRNYPMPGLNGKVVIRYSL